MGAVIMRAAFRRGVLGGSRAWLVIGGMGLAVRLLRKLGGSEEKVVLREELPVGSALIIANEPR
jgi:hypothetical protein